MSTPVLDQAQQHAADELIAVTGDKTVKRTWDLADAIATATPDLKTEVLTQIRQGAVDAAGHDEFWSVSRLKQIGRTAQAWPAGDRIADVALDAHMEVYRKVGDIAKARAVILKVQNATGGASIRDLRAELGANGTTAQPPRIDKAGVDEFWRRIVPMKDALKKHLRGRIKVDRKAILEFFAVFEELKANIEALEGAKAVVDAQPVAAPTGTAVRKTRNKGL